MNYYKHYMEMAVSTEDLSIGQEYNFRGQKIKFIGYKKDFKGKINSEILDDSEFKKPTLIFKWMTGDNSPSSFGRKGDIVAISKKIFKKEAKG